MRELHEYEDPDGILTVNKIRKAVKQLNETGYTRTPVRWVGLKSIDVLQNFIFAIHDLGKQDAMALPNEVKKFYHSIPQQIFTDISTHHWDVERYRPQQESDLKAELGILKPVPAEKIIPTEEELFEEELKRVDTYPDVDSTCPTFKSGWSERDKICKQCKIDFPEEYEACKEVTGDVNKKLKRTRLKAPKSAILKDAILSCYGHRLGTMAGDIDEMLQKGVTEKDAVMILCERHNRSKERALSKFKSHMSTLYKTKGITVTLEDGIYQATQKYGKYLDEKNTASSLSRKPKGIGGRGRVNT